MRPLINQPDLLIPNQFIYITHSSATRPDRQSRANGGVGDFSGSDRLRGRASKTKPKASNLIYLPTCPTRRHSLSVCVCVCIEILLSLSVCGRHRQSCKVSRWPTDNCPCCRLKISSLRCQLLRLLKLALIMGLRKHNIGKEDAKLLLWSKIKYTYRSLFKLSS